MTCLGDVNSIFIVTECSQYHSEAECGKFERCNIVGPYYIHSQNIPIHSPRIHLEDIHRLLNVLSSVCKYSLDNRLLPNYFESTCKLWSSHACVWRKSNKINFPTYCNLWQSFRWYIKIDDSTDCWDFQE